MVTPLRLLQVQEPVETVSDEVGIDISIGLVLNAALVVLVAYAIAWVTDRVLQEFADRLLADRFRVTLLIPMVKVGIYALAAYTVVAMTIGTSQEQMVAFAGLFGAALGFGFKELVVDILGGLSIIVERPYRIGDKVSIGDHYGEVVDIGLRSTQIVTLDDDLVTIPNHVFFRESIVNANAGNAEMLVTVEFYAAHESDPSTATRIVEEAITTSQYVYVTDDKPVSIRLDDGPFYYTITGKAYINDLRNEAAFTTDVTDRVLRAFHNRGIELPQDPRAGTIDAES